MLAYDSYGDDAPGTPILIVHGLFGSARNWGVIARRLSKSRRVVAVDMRNHGDSPREPSHSYPDMAADLAEVIEHIGGEALVIGHSMGGKAAMVLALTHPELVRALIVADIAPVAYEHTQMHLVEAMQALDLATLETRSDADAALAHAGETKGVRPGDSYSKAECDAMLAREIIAYYEQFYEMRFVSYRHFVSGHRTSTEAMMRVRYVATEPGLPKARGQVCDVPFACFGEVRGGRYTRIRMIFSFVEWINIVS